MNINNNHHKTNVDLAYQSFIQIQMTNTGFLRRRVLLLIMERILTHHR